MTAFLVSWFTSLNCPVINLPTPLNLCGPAWRLEQWTHAAASLGIPVRSVDRHVRNNSKEQPPTRIEGFRGASIIVVGEYCFGAVDEMLRRQARALAATARVCLVGVGFSGPSTGAYFTGADLIPELSDEVADAVLECLLDCNTGSADRAGSHAAKERGNVRTNTTYCS